MGRTTAELFAREGATVAITDVNEDLGRDAARKIVDGGGKARFWALNVSETRMPSLTRSPTLSPPSEA
jgi:NAD(P)-dependent dehydrogenase (short-subunit alcohol dehydrogenase family)